MNYVTEIQQLIGNTPLLELTHSEIPNGCRILPSWSTLTPAAASKTVWAFR